MQISSEWVDSVNYWLRRYRAADSGGFVAPGQGGNPIPQRFALFELKGDLTPGGTCTAYQRLSISGAAWSTATSGTNCIITQVCDINGNLRAWGRDTVTGYYSSGHGAYCVAQHDDFLGSNVTANDVWNIVAIQQQSERIKVSIGTGCVAAGASFTPTALAVMDRGQDPSFGGNHYPSITNYSSPIGNSGAGTGGIICVWDESIPGYLVIDAPCPAGC